MTLDKNLVPEEVLDQLYAARPEDFVRLRNEQASALKKQGADGAASELKALSRPTVVAWALNQLSRQVPEHVDALIAAGQDVERAHRRLLSGVDAHGLQDTMQARRKLLSQVEEDAVKILETSGRSAEPHRGGIAATLQTASVEREGAELLRKGRFTRELPPPSGFGNLTGLSLVRDSGAKERPQTTHAREVRERRSAIAGDNTTARRTLALAKERAGEAHRSARVAQRRAEAAERRAETARRNASGVEERAKKARALADRMDEDAEARRAAAKEAQKAADAADRELASAND